MTRKESIQRLIKSAWKSLDELDKVINQIIDLEALDPEKAKIASAGKVEAIKGSMEIISKIVELEKIIDDEENSKVEGTEGDNKRDGQDSEQDDAQSNGDDGGFRGPESYAKSS